MGARTEPVGIPEFSSDRSRMDARIDDLERASILEELDAILNSQHFRSSSRSRQFLSYVVHHRLEGNIELLKERTLGVELFQRPAGYATGDDAVVRVQAGEVRRRLEQYYHGAAHGARIRIHLPVGTYVPEFRFVTPLSGPLTAALPWAAPAADTATHPWPQLIPALPQARLWPWSWSWLLPGFGLVLILAIALIGARSAKPKESALEQFWSPVFVSPQAVLLCLEKPIVYRPSSELYQRYAKSHPDTFQTELDRNTRDLPLNPKEKILWGDMIATPGFGVAVGDVNVAARLSALFARLNKPSQVRIGSSFSFEDLRNSPSVLVGAFNNRWTLQMTSNFHFVFAEKQGVSQIVEQGPGGRVWASRRDGRGVIVDEDYAVVTRELDSKTGQLLIAVAGIGDYGTRAAGELISSEDLLAEAMKTAPPDWQKKNIQIVLQTSVTDLVPGPPRVIAIYFW